MEEDGLKTNLNEIFATLYDIQPGDLLDASFDVKELIRQADWRDPRFHELNAYHISVTRAIKLSMTDGVGIGSGYPLITRTPEEIDEIKNAGGVAKFKKNKFVDFAIVAYTAEPAFFIQRLRHNFSKSYGRSMSSYMFS